jgi:hypothetical protein
MAQVVGSIGLTHQAPVWLELRRLKIEMPALQQHTDQQQGDDEQNSHESVLNFCQ